MTTKVSVVADFLFFGTQTRIILSQVPCHSSDPAEMRMLLVLMRRILMLRLLMLVLLVRVIRPPPIIILPLVHLLSLLLPVLLMMSLLMLIRLPGRVPQHLPLTLTRALLVPLWLVLLLLLLPRELSGIPAMVHRPIEAVPIRTRIIHTVSVTPRVFFLVLRRPTGGWREVGG